MNESVCNANLSFSFSSREQCSKFIKLFLKNNSEQINDFGEKIEPYSNVTIDRFREAVDFLKRAYIYAHRIDWLESGDDSEEDFHTRLTEELIKLEQ